MIDYQKKYEMLLEFLKLGRDEFNRQMIKTNKLLEKSEKSLTALSSANEQEAVIDLYRLVHTLHGHAQAAKLGHLSSLADKIEQIFQDYLKKQTTLEKTKIYELFTNLKQTHAEYETIANDELENAGVKDSKFTRRFEQLALGNEEKSPADKGKILTTLIQEYDQIFAQRLDEIVATLKQSITQECIKLGKKAPSIKITSEGGKYLNSIQPTLQDVFLHCFRNSIDHGLEQTEIRLQKGKPLSGTIEIKEVSNKNHVSIIYSDDGRGLNLAKLKQKANKAGASDQEIAELIFQSGVSTADKVGRLSGQGVGMDAVRYFLNEKKCSIDLVLLSPQNPDGFCPFQLVIKIANNHLA